MFAVLQLNKYVELSVQGQEIELPLVYAEGMIGAIPVFDSREAAEVFAGNKYKVAELITGDSNE